MPCLAAPASGRLLSGLLALVALLLTVPASVAGAASGPGTDAVESDLLSRVNAARGGGSAALKAHPQLAAAAHAQAAWLAAMAPAERRALTPDAAHCGGPGCPAPRAVQAGWPDGQTLMGEITRLGDREGAPAEANARAIGAWQASAHHRRQLHRASWRAAGAAIVGDVAVVVFAERCTTTGCVRGTAPTALPSGEAGDPRDPGTPPAPAAGAAPTAAGTEGAAARCRPLGRVRVLRRASRRRELEVRLSCRRPGGRYTARLRDGARARTVALRRARTVVRVRASRRTRWVDVSVAAGGTSLGSVRVRIPAA